MNKFRFLITAFLIFLLTGMFAQKQQTFYRTATTYEKFKWDKVPFAMSTLIVTIYSDDSVMLANRVFTKASDGIYTTKEGNGCLVLTENNAFIVKVPNGTDWTCYYADKERIREIASNPDYSGSDEMEKLKEALSSLKKADPRTQTFYLVYSSFLNSANTEYAQESLPLIVQSADSIILRGYWFTRYRDNLFRSASGNYLYLPENGTFMVRDKDFSEWATYYVKDKTKADQLIATEFTPKKELDDLNDLINNVRSSKNTNTINNYVRGLRSKRTDPVLESAILKYWNGRWPGSPASKVIFVDPDLSIVRNDIGVVLRKNITAWVIYKEGGKCYMQWHNYGYESLGGGAFDKELIQWKMSELEYSLQAGTLNLFSGQRYEVDCSVLK